MGLASTHDSLANLLQIKEDKQETRKAVPAAHGKRSNNSTISKRPLQKQTSFRAKKDQGGDDHDHNDLIPSDAFFYDDDEILGYEPCDVKEADEDHWPVWEMTGGDPWRDHDQSYSSNSDASIAAGIRGITSSIAESERIFTVPEVYDDLMKEQEQQQKECARAQWKEGLCHDNIFNCFLNPWKKQPPSITPAGPRVQSHDTKNDAFQDATSAGSDHGKDCNEDQQTRQGVIKRSSMAVQLYLGMPASVRQSFTPSMFKILMDCDDNEAQESEESSNSIGGQKRRASIVGNKHNQIYHDLDGVMNDNNDGNSRKELKIKVHFSELKQVLRVCKITPEEASDVWYKCDDFNKFKHEMSLLIQRDEASRELAEAWLEATKGERPVSEPVSEETKYSKSGTRSSIRRPSSWWHNYNHSRRGLERYASPGQASQILASYKVAVRKVLGEQERQRLLMGCFGCIFPKISCGCAQDEERPHYNADPTVEKIAQVYHEYTAWSRDLALAAGASDADAVGTNFNDDERHTREYYMLKQVVASGYKVHKHMPQFMLPECITPKGFLNEGDSLYCDEIGAMMARNSSPASQKKSMAEKAKNYPFQK